MLSSIIRKLYHFKPRFESEVKKKKDKKSDKKKKDVDQESKKEGDRALGEDDTDEEEDEMQMAMKQYKFKMTSMKESAQRLYNSMEHVLGKGKVNFNFKTTGILGMMFCLRIIRNRESLRMKSRQTR